MGRRGYRIDPFGLKERLYFRAMLLEIHEGSGPGMGLLSNFAGSMAESALCFFFFVQMDEIQQTAHDSMLL